MSTKKNLKIKAEIFKLTTLSKITSYLDKSQNRPTKRLSSAIKNDELGYFNPLENL